MPEATDPRRKYRNPPIQEAVCEVHFVHPKPLSQQEITQMGEHWKKDYPQQQVVEEKALRLEIALGKSQTSEEVLGHKLLARSNDGKDIVQLGASLLAVNRLPPYAGWEETFREVIQQRFREAFSVFGFSAISRLNLRYINRIEVPESPLVWRRWFMTAPPIPVSLAGEPQFFQSQTQLPLVDDLVATINFSTIPGASKPIVMLDIDVLWQGKIPIEGLASALDKVHLPHNVLFESYLTDSLRAVFDPL